MVVTRGVSQNSGDFLSGWATVGFSRKTLIDWVSYVTYVFLLLLLFKPKSKLESNDCLSLMCVFEKQQKFSHASNCNSAKNSFSLAVSVQPRNCMKAWSNVHTVRGSRVHTSSVDVQNLEALLLGLNCRAELRCVSRKILHYSIDETWTRFKFYNFHFCRHFYVLLTVYVSDLTSTVKPRLTNASDHEQFGLQKNFPNTKRLGWRTVSRVTNTKAVNIVER
jgi:hypothetical protein